MSSETAEPPKKRRAVRTIVFRWLRRLLALALLAAVAGAVALWAVLRHYDHDLPSTKELRDYQPPQVTRVLARDGTLLAELYVERRTVVPIDQIPAEMKVAALAAEDADFYRHEGLDYFGMLRALWVNVRSASARQGGSTITQQVVKNVLLGPERTFERKAREVLLARRIEQELSKDQILELYLNHIYLGHGRYGVEEASRYYFGKGVDKLSLSEAAMLAGLAKGPSLYSPRVDLVRAKRRRDLVLDQLADKGFATSRRVEEAKREPIVLAPAPESLPELAPEVVEEVRRTLREREGAAAARGGYTVHTTIDAELQAAARRALRDSLDDYAERHKLLGPLAASKDKSRTPFQGTPAAKGHKVYWGVVTGADDAKNVLRVRAGTVDGQVDLRAAERYNPKGLAPSRFAAPGTLVRVSPVLEKGVGSDGVPRELRLELAPQGALIALDVKSREVLALVGSYESVRGGLDRTLAHRQPGSTFKPFVYSYGVHARRFTPATIIELPQAAPVNGAEPAPPLFLRDALARSVNDAAVWAYHEVGGEGVVSWAHTLGVESKLAPTESLALGAYEVTPRELAAAYATFAAGGIYEQPLLIREIRRSDHSRVPLASRAEPRRVMDEAEAYLVTSLLTSVVQYGTGRAARDVGLPLAGKTGTSNDARDAWFAGYSPEVVCVVWTGYDDNIALGKRESGATVALPAFVSLMKRAHEGHHVPAWQRPGGITVVSIDPQSGLLPYEGQEDAREEIFLAGTEPSAIAERSDAGAGGGGGAHGAGGGAPTEVPPPAPEPQAAVPPPAASESPPPF